MGKRDIRIDYDAIDDVLRELNKYSDGLEKMRNAVEKVNKTIHASNEAESIKKLEKRYRKTKKRLDDSYEEVNALYTLLKDYKNDMTAIIKPKKGMTRVGRNDIYWNLKAIKAAIHEIQDVKSDVPLYYEDGTGCTDEEKQRMGENYRKLENQIWTPILSSLNKALDDSKDKLEKYYKEKVVEYENMDDHYRWEAEKVRMKYASTWEHMKQAGINYAEEQSQIAKGALRAVKDLAESLEFIGQVVYHVNGAEVAAVVKHLSPNPPEWTEKMLGESKDYFGEFAEILASPVDVVKAMAQNASDTYEIEGASYAGAYIITDSLIGKATASGISKVVGKGAGAAGDIAGIANKADDVTDAAKITGKVDDAAEIAGITGKADDVTGIADDIADFYDDVYKGCYEEPFNPIEEGVMLDPDDVVDAARTAEKTSDVVEMAQDGVKVPDYIRLCKELGDNLNKVGYKILDVKPAEIANLEWADMGYDLPPVAVNTTAYTVEAGDFSYARVYLEGYNNPMSNFILRSDDIAGLTAKEVAQKYALPKVPNKVVNVELPIDTPLEVSIVGPQETWGTVGGDVQYAIKDVNLNPKWFDNIKDLN